MITKTGSLIKLAMSPEVKQAIKTDPVFRKAYQEFINRAGGSGADVEDLYKTFYSKSSGTNAGGNWEQDFKQQQQQRRQQQQQQRWQQQHGSGSGSGSKSGFKFNFGGRADFKRAQGFNASGVKGSVLRGLGSVGAASLGGLGAYSAYKYFRDRKAA